MDVLITPAKLSGSLVAPTSKSYAQRFLIASALADRPTTLHINGLSDDIKATVKALEAMGARFLLNQEEITVFPIKTKDNPQIFCGESATAARLILPVAAALFDQATLKGQGSLLNRPFGPLCQALSSGGVVFESTKLPITFRGRLQAGEYKIDGSLSSQYLSGLMLALPLLEGSSSISITSPLSSAGYVQMTEHTLRVFRVEGGYFTPGNQNYLSPREITVEGDWSNSAFWLAGGVEVQGLNPSSLQRDRLFVELRQMASIDGGDVPDLVPILAVCAALREGETEIYNIARLSQKESNRLQSVSTMINSLGGEAVGWEDRLIVKGRGGLIGGQVESSNDHRIVMASAIASCFCRKPVLIRGVQAVNKSYPQFFTHFNRLGGKADVF